MISLLWNKINIWKRQDNLFKTLLTNRKINKSNENSFLNPSFNDLLDPFLFEDMENIIKRILETRKNKERVVIFWDYDVDGVSSTALLVKFFSEIWIQISYRLPHRVNDWYWLKKYFIDDILEKNVKLLITVDCWTRDVEIIDYAVSLWIDVIITDHHFVPEVISQKIIWIINPKNPNSTYPNKDLSGSWVAFKLLHWVASKIYNEKELEKILKKYIDFAMLWTIADCMELKWENRTIAHLGLQQIKNSHSHWLKKLLEWKNLDDIDGDIIWFQVGPRLNAAWRIDSPYKALKLLLAWEQNIDEIVEEIEDLNTKRKLQSEIFLSDAIINLENKWNVIFYDSEDIGHWIIGLIAWRLCEQFGKIAIVTKIEEEKIVGSCRSPENVSIIEILEECSDYFEAFGWHDQAAWFTISKEKFELFKEKISKIAEFKCENINITKNIQVEAEIELYEIDRNLLDFIQKLKPFWLGNPKPLFYVKNVQFDKVDYLWKDYKHLKFGIIGNWLEFKAFKFWEYFEQIKNSKNLGIIFEIEKNNWNWRQNISLNIKDFLLC